MMPMQKIVMVAGVLLLLALLFPPFQDIHPMGGAQNAGYSFIFFPPEGEWGNSEIDVAVLLIQWIGILLISTIFTFAVHYRKLLGFKNNQITDQNKAEIIKIEKERLLMAERYDEGEISTVDLEKHRIHAEQKIRDLLANQKTVF